MLGFIRVTILFVFVGSVGAIGSETPDDADPVAVVKANLAKNSKMLGLSASSYKYALDQYARLYLGDEVPAMPMVHQIPELISPSLYSEQEVIAAMNEQKTEFANFLGVPVATLEPFLNHVADFLEPDLVKTDLLEKGSAAKSLEEVVVFCLEACGQMPYLDVSIMVYQAALAQNIPNYRDYEARFFNPGTTTQPASVEVWRHSSSAGAWR